MTKTLAFIHTSPVLAPAFARRAGELLPDVRIGKAVELSRPLIDIPVLQVDEPMADGTASGGNLSGMLRRTTLRLLIGAAISLRSTPGQDAGAARTYLVKLSVPVSTNGSKPGDRIRAAIVSPESLLNGYLKGIVKEITPRPNAKLVLQFDSVLYKGKSTPIESEVIDFVNSKGHKSVDDDERPLKLERGVFSSSGTDLWLDEGAELRVSATPPKK
jgi:hypothetical protein